MTRWGALALVPLVACSHARPVVAAHGGGAGMATFGTYVDHDYGFTLERPTGDGWSISTGVPSPDGFTIPLLVVHKRGGVQIVVQVADTDASPSKMARLLADHIKQDPAIATGSAQQIDNNAGEVAYGFGFRLGEEAAGRVAVVSMGDRMILVIASWPVGADGRLVDQVDRLVMSVRPSPRAQGRAAESSAPKNDEL